MVKYIAKIFIVLFCLLSIDGYATHNRAGEITYEQTGELQIRVTITTYTKESSATADRDSLEVFWGDGTSEFVLRTDETSLPNDVKVNKYVQIHDYPGRSTYTIYFEDPNRVSNILNVNPPNSVDVPFFLSTTFTFLDPQFQGTNNSAILLQPPLDVACPGQTFVHNPNAYDSDGDSLSYELVTPFSSVGEEIDNYLFPNEIAPGANNIISMNEVTGDFIWDAPQLQGEYNIAIRINEYRDGVLINTIIRDMQILVQACDNRPPVIEVVDEICVVAGELIDLPVMVSDLDTSQRVELTASGGPFIQDTSSAILQVVPGFLQVPYTARLRWQTTCEHISAQYYQIVFRALDNGFGNNTGLATLKTLRIKVVGPAPENLDAASDNSNIRIRWDFPYSCSNALNDYFQGFSIWRREGSNSFPIDTCNEGIEGQGYTRIVFNTSINDGSEYFFIDTDVEKGKTYCYRVLGEFAQISSSGFRYNHVPSLSSNEICAQVSRDLPLITKVSVDSTHTDTGMIHVRWTKPLPDDLDTLTNFGPYTYTIKRNIIGQNEFEDIQSQTTLFFNSPIDTNYIDTNLNTVDNQYNYKIELKTGNNSNGYGESAEASSIFATASPGDGKAILDWSAMVPWDNYNYDLYRINENLDTILLQSFAIESGYIDNSVDNNRRYCYYLDALGSYRLNNIEDPLKNRSQNVCVTPIDNEPPCPLVLEVTNVCSDDIDPVDIEEFSNVLIWNIPSLDCELISELSGFNIYYASNNTSELELLTVLDGNQSEYIHMPTNGILGCYSITAIDSVGNESMQSNIICVDNCPLYELPNTFTPNDDGSNDILVPRINRFIKEVEFKIFNEWGNLIFTTNDPNINWNGMHENGNEVPDGTYYYTCKVIENRVSGDLQQSRLLRGYIHIIRS